MADPHTSPTAVGGHRIDEATGTSTVGHEWDGIEELNTPLPRWWLLFCRLLAGSMIAILQAYVFLAIAALYGIRFPWFGYLAAAPAALTPPSTRAATHS